MKILSVIKTLAAGLTLCGLTSCGGGGGGGGVSGAAFVRIQVRPQSIDTGDRIKVEIDVREIHENGISLKIRFPTELSFVPSSAEILTSEDDDFNLVPDVSQSTENDSYLVFYVDGNDFGENEEGTLSFELQGREAKEDALIEVDPDVDDPLVDNGIEFNVEQPQFEAEEETYVQVRG